MTKLARMWRRLAVVAAMVTVATVAILVSGCSDDSSEVTLPESLMAAIDAAESRDASSLASQAVFSTVACTTEGSLGGPPLCGPGQADGTEIEVLPASGCGEASYIEKGAEPIAFENFLAGEIRLHAAYQSDGTDRFPASYAILLESTGPPLPEPQGRAIFVSAEGVTGLFFGCNDTVDGLRARFTAGEPLWTP